MAPFKTDREQVEASGSEYPFNHALFVFDSRGTTAVSIYSRKRCEARGHGRHIHLKDGIARHHEWQAWFKHNVPKNASLDDVARILNEAWAGEGMEVDDATP